MKLTLVFFLLCISSAFAVNVDSQNARVNIHAKNMQAKEVIEQIEEQTDYLFVYNHENVDLSKKVSIVASNTTVKDVLSRIFKNSDITYAMEGTNIMLLKKKEVTDLQQSTKKVTGTITDQAGEPVIGANVIVKGTGTGTVTDVNGKFSVDVVEGAILQISFIGYLPRELKVGSQNTITVVLNEDVQALEEVVVVGYGTQKKATLTGAVSSVKGSDVVATKNENVQNMLTGKMAGVRVTQKTSEPGAFNNNLDIRGMGNPLIIIDGIPRSNEAFQRLNPNDIDNISILKDASAAIYGVRAANGVVLVTTKKGDIEGVEMEYSGSFSFQFPSGLPATLDAIDYMTLRNERSMHNLNGGSLIFNDAEFEKYRSGEKQSTDWYPLVFSDFAPSTQHNLSITGGYQKKINFFVGLGYLYQEGFFKSRDLNYDKYNIRSNVTAKITDRLKFDLNLNLTMDQQNRPYQDSWWIIRGFWRQGPHIPAYADPEKTMLYHGLIEGDNPISFMNKDVVGYRKYNRKWSESTGTLTYDIPGVKGLSVKGSLTYDYQMLEGNVFNKEYNQFRYDEASGVYTKYVRQSPNSVQREFYKNSLLMTQLLLNYDRKFNDIHKVSGLLVWETQQWKGDNFYAKRNLAFPLEYLFAGVSKEQLASMNVNNLYDNANEAFAGKFNYSYADKYLLDFVFRYDGSSKFAPGHQWGFYPAVSAGWRVSEEDFFKNSPLSFINELKLRGSYGKTGDDAASSYQFISGYTYPGGKDRRNFSGGYVFDGEFAGSAVNKGIPNPEITWYTAKTLNIGVDMEAWDGLLGATVEYFSRDREGLLATRSGGIPTVVGASLPQENLNGDRTFGLELELSHRKIIGDFFYRLKGIATVTRVKRLYVERGTIGNSWNNWKNNQNDRLQGVHSGYNGAGRFESWEQIWNHPVYIGRGTILGDYIYEDWNGDGEINGNDSHPIRFNQYPWVNFSLNVDAVYKGFDLNLLFQGSALSSLVYGEQLREPLWGSGDASAMEQFMDRWHPVDPKADPYDPSIQWNKGHFAYTGTLPDTNSSFNCENGAYLRLKSIELGYTLPFIKGINSLRVFANAYNIFTITKVKYVDPEHPNDTYGYLYPLNKTLSVGLNLSF